LNPVHGIGELEGEMILLQVLGDVLSVPLDDPREVLSEAESLGKLVLSQVRIFVVAQGVGGSGCLPVVRLDALVVAKPVPEAL